MTTLSEFFTPAKGGIKSVQSGVVLVSGSPGSVTVTVSAVNPAKSILLLSQQNGYAYDMSGYLAWAVSASGVITNSTTLTFQRGYIAHPSYSHPPVVAWQLVEYE